MSEQPRRRIVTANADEVLRYLLARYLREEGFLVFEASTGAQALALVECEAPALAVLDVELPDVSGYCVGRTLWQSKATSSVRVLYTSDARATARRRIEGLGAGGDASMTHPVDRDEFITTVTMLLGSQHDRRGGRAPWAWPSLRSSANSVASK
jgi:DNA-binding response OmpR family regulator